MIKLQEIPSESEERRIKYDIIKDNMRVGKVDIILFSDVFKQHKFDPTLIHEVSIVVDNDFRKQGIGKQAMLCLMDEVKNIPLMYPLWSIVHETNYASIKLHEKLPYIKKKLHRQWIFGGTEVYVCYQLTQ